MNCVRVAEIQFIAYAEIRMFLLNNIGESQMSRNGSFALLLLFITLCGTAMAAKPEKPPQEAAVAAPNVFSVKVDYLNGLVIVEGENLSAGTASATFAGISLAPDPASSDTELQFAFTSELTAAVDEMGNYVVIITTDGGSFSLSAFIPFALTVPGEPPPPGLDCPCSPEWDSASTTPSPDGFAGLTPFCSEDSGNWVTVQVSDSAEGNYWVMWTGWDSGAGTGYCELFIDSPSRTLSTEEQFNACAVYLRDIVTVWGSQGNDCIF